MSVAPCGEDPNPVLANMTPNFMTGSIAPPARSTYQRSSNAPPRTVEW